MGLALWFAPPLTSSARCSERSGRHNLKRTTSWWGAAPAVVLRAPPSRGAPTIVLLAVRGAAHAWLMTFTPAHLRNGTPQEVERRSAATRRGMSFEWRRIVAGSCAWRQWWSAWLRSAACRPAPAAACSAPRLKAWLGRPPAASVAECRTQRAFLGGWRDAPVRSSGVGARAGSLEPRITSGASNLVVARALADQHRLSRCPSLCWIRLLQRARSGNVRVRLYVDILRAIAALPELVRHETRALCIRVTSPP